MPLGVGLELLGDFGMLIEDVGRFVWVLFHVEQRQFDPLLGRLAGLTVVGGFDERSVSVREVEFPATVAADDALEPAADGEGIPGTPAARARDPA